MDQTQKDNNQAPQMPKTPNKDSNSDTKNNSLPAIFGGIVFLIFALFIILTPFDFSYPFPFAHQKGSEQALTSNQNSNGDSHSNKEYQNAAKSPDYHEYDKFAFIAPGTWRVEMQGPVYPEKDNMRAKVITSNPYEVQITTSTIPSDKMDDVKNRLVYSFKETTEDVHDYVDNLNGTYVYAGGWQNDIVGGVDSIEAMYSILDTKTNVYTMVSIVGPISDKDQVIDIFKSAEYDGMPLYKM